MCGLAQVIRLGARRKAEDQGALGWEDCSPVSFGNGGQRAREMQELRTKVEEGAARIQERASEVQELQKKAEEGAAREREWEWEVQELQKKVEEGTAREQEREREVQELQAKLAAAKSAWQDAQVGQEQDKREWTERVRAEAVREREALLRQNTELEDKIVRLRSDMAVLDVTLEGQQRQGAEWSEVLALVKGLSALDLTSSLVRRDLMLYLQDVAACPGSSLSSSTSQPTPTPCSSHTSARSSTTTTSAAQGTPTAGAEETQAEATPPALVKASLLELVRHLQQAEEASNVSDKALAGPPPPPATNPGARRLSPACPPAAPASDPWQQRARARRRAGALVLGARTLRPWMRAEIVMIRDSRKLDNAMPPTNRGTARARQHRRSAHVGRGCSSLRAR